ncbi:cyanophycin synthetase [Flavobacterium cyanobacteriorum]|uniref:Cyanophycin synthetase n=1 Tax=Flavobacterium cyanobacteriorum TaxID=2022802 RepID=A0A255Z2P2_9FLAO|nr:cyanophycin synthetase [Flavobacterium cyanobacteriorum]OYQ35711.1 cyanophycin synthetase [Flavobacterium cyanobacteriorum]
MKIVKIQVLRGPNVWSNYRKKLIQMRLDLEEMEYYPTDRIPGFRERLQQLLPTMVEHECSEDKRGGFFLRVELGTWMGHVIEHIALEIQQLAGMETGYGRTRSTYEKGVYNVVFAYTDEEAGIYAAKAAVRIAEALIAGMPYPIEDDIEKLREICEYNCLGPSTKSIVTEAEKRGIPWMRIGSGSMIQLGYGNRQMRFQATTTCKTNVMAVDIACNKKRTKELLEMASVPVPKGSVCNSVEKLKDITDELGYPLVIKPLDGNQGKGATINITTWDEAVSALAFAQLYSSTVIVERYIKGHDFRVLVIDNKYVAAAKRMPAYVKGNGVDTIKTLIEEVNADPRRGNGHANVLTKIKVDRDTEEMLKKQQHTLDSVPHTDEIVFLKSTANLSTGGCAEDVTDTIHPANIALAERIAKVIGLDICGIDIMAETLEHPIKETGGAVIEVNAAPGFRMHLAPTAGRPRNVAAPVIDMLYPEGTESRIPVIGVTGTNGKTTTTRLLAHIAKTSGYKTGYTTTDGIYIDGELHQKGDTTGPASAQYILRDPSVEFAVLETARGGMLRSGMGYDQCDIGIITNIKEDHLELNDIHTLEDLAEVKSIVVRSVKRDGWAVLNAEDEQCVNITDELDCNVAFFSLDEENEHIKRFCSEGKTVAVFENGYITIKKGNKKIRIINVSNVPVTLDGKVKFMIANAMAAALGAYLWGFTTKQIAAALQSFVPGFEQTPGRLNLFEFRRFNVLVDYAHNPHGYLAVEDYLKNVGARRKIGIICGIGDRRDEDIKECALIAGRMFDHVILRQDADLRGRPAEEIHKLLVEGLDCCEKRVTHEYVGEETEAMRHAIEIAEEGDLVVALTDRITDVVNVVKEHQAREERENMVQSA